MACGNTLVILWAQASVLDKINGRVNLRSMLLAAAAALALALPLAASPMPAAAQQQVADPALAEVLAHARRAEDRGRDQYRHPAETLAFFQIKPGMTVVDYLPAGGWYTRILVPYLGPQGQYIAMGPDLTGETNQYFLNTMGGLADKFAGQAAGWDLGQGARISAFNTPAVPAELEGKVDAVLSFREFHNQFRFGWLHEDMLAIRRLLKPGGLLGLTDHRAQETAPYAMTDGNKGYVRESDVIEIMDAYGFDLVGKSEINANPKDTKDYPRGVWELPPSLAGATDASRPQRLAIGESDRMTLLFRKRD